MTMVEVDFHLRRAGLVAQRVDVDLLNVAMVVDILKQRVEFIDRINPVSLAGLLRPTGLSGRGGQRVVGISTLLDKKEFQLGCHDRIQPGVFKQRQHPFQHRARCERNDVTLVIVGVMNDLRRRLGIPGNETTAVRIWPQYHISADFIQHLTIEIGTGYRLPKDIFGKPQSPRPRSGCELVDRQNLATWDTGNIADKAFNLGDRLRLQPAMHVERHPTSP